MALSSDEIIKREIKESVGTKIGDLTLVIFPQSSNDDQKPFSEGGLTFGIEGIPYGSCDACWVKDGNWRDPLTGKVVSKKPIVALEGTDALNRGSSGNAQYQRFHHALGAVKAGIIGVYYLKRGIHKIQEDLFGMAYFASKSEKGKYLIIQELEELKELLLSCDDENKLNDFLDNKLQKMFEIFNKKFKKRYGGDWKKFAKARSTIMEKDYIIKHSARTKRNFTDGSQRAGHIALGEMYLTKYFFPKMKFYYLWARMNKEDLSFLDKHKSNDKEWKLLRNEKNVKIITIDDLDGVSEDVKKTLNSVKDTPLKGSYLSKYKKSMKLIIDGFERKQIKIKDESLI